jgi:hypothetical protein
MNQKGRPNSNQLKQLKSPYKYRVYAQTLILRPDNRDNLGFLLRNRLVASQYLNVRLSSSGNNLTGGLCVAKYFRKLPARMSQNADLTTI